MSDDTTDTGRVPEGTGLSQAEPVTRLGPSGFDPSRNMVEHVARELWLARASCKDKEAVWDGLSARDREPYLRDALAAISALREPTELMIEASNREWDGRLSHRSSGAWQAMIDAALDDFEREVVYYCEGCGAPLYANDQYYSDENGVVGCWHMMVDDGESRAPCYAPRVGKPHAAIAMEARQGGDVEQAPSRSDDSADPKGIAHE